ncbi:hypothetical protein HMPREF1624_07608 [Sporothrix schenckii ATCC 58251]|uniref:C3H1-type domain-containing protein n=1 Tax=Sporothrix schenckii (strain ATCC 58251 / de Perez 2211183) TaxID=1391915 RepID=U7PKI3_SPOS1|nr:hypothetical protein HMPREF1624_07608 [Sporothrix schenckii ATCC 58251]
MTSEDQELLARISQLAGHINRHKNQQAGISSVPSSPYNNYSTPPSSSTHHAPSYRRQPYALRGRGFGSGGYRVNRPAPYRNRTLVLNGSGAPSRSDGAENGDSTAASDSGSGSGGPSTTWVARNDRHMQLINADVYEKDAQSRARAIEKTRVEGQKMRDARERAKLRRHFSHLAHGRPTASNGNGSRSGSTTPQSYQVVIEGIPFAVAKNGSKLMKLPSASALLPLSPPRSPGCDFYEDSAHPSLADPHPASSTPKTAVVGGVKFYRSKNGNLYRHGVVKAQQRRGGSTIKKTDEPCSCSKGPSCRFLHNAAKVAACKDFLLKGDCARGSDCDLSHDLTPERTPFCVHFAKGNCTNPHCSYTHSQVSSGAPVCRPFGLYGYCDRGADCTARHVFECPDFSNTGVCKIKGCKLPHRERASFMRRTIETADKSETTDSDSAYVDVSSDDESVNSDDVDSDEVDEFVGADGDEADLDFVTQKDYIEI